MVLNNNIWLDRISKVDFAFQPIVNVHTGVCYGYEALLRNYKEAGFENVKVIGGPNFIYPGMDETYVHGSTESIQNKLEDAEVYNKILDIEFDNYNNSDIAARANALMVIAKK